MRTDGKHAALVKAFGKRGDWFKLHQLADIVGGGETAVSARIRELRQAEHGAHNVEVRRMASGTYYYRINPASALVAQRLEEFNAQALEHAAELPPHLGGAVAP